MAVVRWPGERPSQSAHVEFNLTVMGARLSYGIVGMGLLLRCASWFSRPKYPDVVVSVTWSVSLVILIFWLGMFTASMLAGGFLQTNAMPIWLLSLCILVGVVYGSVRLWMHAKVVSSETNETQLLAEAGHDETLNRNARPHMVGWGLLIFTLGLVASLSIGAAVEVIVSLIPGSNPPHVWGSPGFPMPAKWARGASGVATIVLGWAVSYLMHRFFRNRAFPLGVVIGATILGIFFVCR